MNLFTLIKKDEIHLAAETKVIPGEDFSQLISAAQIITKTKEEETAYRIHVAKECETLKELAEAAGFDAGLKKWNEQIQLLETEIKKVRKEMENAIVPLALTAVKKIIGKELETKPETIVDVVATSLKTVLHHRKVSIYVNQLDLEQVEAQKTRLKSLFEHLETLSIAARGDVQQGGCVIETEAGIINAQLENQLLALETAFRNFFQNRSRGDKL
jgi:type III secretion protein L